MALRYNRDRTSSFGRFLWQRFVDDKCFETAGALSYTTLVSLVPLMVAALAMFSVFPVFESARDTLLDFVFRSFVPAAGRHVQDALQVFASNASGLTGISILVMLFSAISMMVSIEDRMNRIWRVQRPRGWVSRLLLYWAALTLGPILVVGGIAVSSYITALPLLQKAGRVVILAAPASSARYFDPARLQQFFSQRDIKSEVQIVTESGDPGPCLLKATKGIEANLLIAGAFGHPRLQEYIFGGTTRAFLNATDGPSLFLSH